MEELTTIKNGLTDVKLAIIDIATGKIERFLPPNRISFTFFLFRSFQAK